MHAVPIHRRAVPLSRPLAAESERDAGTASGSPAATACGPTSGTSSRQRFRIPHILEFYGATEGNVNIFNFEGKPGAVGRVPWFVAHRFPIAVVRFDVERQQPVRDAEGFCIRCDADEPGEVIGQIVNDPAQARQPLRGLRRRQPEREQDPAQRVREGRRLVPHRRPDAQGRATAISISSTASATPSAGRARTSRPPRWPRRSTPSRASRDANVYGVTVAGRDGRAGMAAIVCEGLAISRRCTRISRANLPDYARPLFLRLQRRDRRDRHVQAEEGRSGARGLRSGGDRTIRSISTIRSAQAFVRLDPALYERIQRGDSAAVIAIAQADGAGVLARGRAGEMVQEGRGVRRRHPRALSRDLRGRRRRRASRTGSDTPTARSRSSSCSISSRATCSAATRAPSPPIRWRARWPTARWRAASIGRVAARERQFFYLPFEHSEATGRPGALLRAVTAAATPTS